jgi:glucose-1-phosphate adenylyltransferase
MAGEKALSLVMAGGAGGRMEQLTAVRAKPAMPYAGVYRLIDFPLSNCMHSGMSDVWILQQFHPHSLEVHVSSGRPWDLDRTYGGLRVVHPHLGGSGTGFHQGNADAIYRNRAAIREFAPGVVVVVSADHVYKLDYRAVIRSHMERNADATLVTTRVVNDDPGRFGVVQVADDGRVSGFDYKPESPAGDLVMTEVFVFNARVLLDRLEQLVSEEEDAEEGETSLEDIGDALLPRLVKDGNVFEHRLESYWRDVGTIDSYWRSHMELLGEKPEFDLDDPAWPIYTAAPQRPPAHVYKAAQNENSLVSPGCKVYGRVVNSVLGPGVTVEEGAEVVNSIVLHDTTVERGAAVHMAIVDMEAGIGPSATVGAPLEGDPLTTGVAASDITIVGRGATVEAGTELEPGGRMDPVPSE